MPETARCQVCGCGFEPPVALGLQCPGCGNRLRAPRRRRPVEVESEADEREDRKWEAMPAFEKHNRLGRRRKPGQWIRVR